MLQLWHNFLQFIAIFHEQGPVAQVKCSKEGPLNLLLWKVFKVLVLGLDLRNWSLFLEDFHIFRNLCSGSCIIFYYSIYIARVL